MKVFILIMACLICANNAYAFDSKRIARTIKNRIKWTVADKAPSEVKGVVYVLTDELLEGFYTQGKPAECPTRNRLQ
jgi:hypothetical protein